LLTVLSDGESAQVAPAPSLQQLDTLLAAVSDAGLDLTRDIDPQLPPLDPTSDVAAYRVIQESLTNMLRHCPQRNGHLTVRGTSTAVEIIATNPVGDQTSSAVGTGRGLIGMRERLAIVGGRLEHAGPLGNLYVVRAVIPAEGNEPRLALPAPEARVGS